MEVDVRGSPLPRSRTSTNSASACMACATADTITSVRDPTTRFLSPHVIICSADDVSDNEPGDECEGDPVAAFEQCGGQDFTGSTCCEDGLECTVMAACYSQVKAQALAFHGACLSSV